MARHGRHVLRECPASLKSDASRLTAIFLQYRDPEEVERDLQAIAEAKALAAAGEAAPEAAQPDYEISGPQAGIAAAATLPSAEAGSSLSLPSSLPLPRVDETLAYWMSVLRLVREQVSTGPQTSPPPTGAPSPLPTLLPELDGNRGTLMGLRSSCNQKSITTLQSTSSRE
jgi:hypothetical protein